MKTKKQNLVIISHEKQWSNKLYAILKQIFLVQQISYNQDFASCSPVNTFDLVLLIGCHSPQDTHAKLKAIKSLPNAPQIVLISDIIDPKFIIHSYRLGVVEFVQIPVDMGELISIIHQKAKQAHQFKTAVQHPKFGELWAKYMPNFGKELFPIEAGVVPKNPLFGISVAPDNMVLIQVQFFGKFSIQIDQQNIENLFSKRTKSLLAFLLYNYRKPISRDKLAELFWPYHATAKNNLNVAIHGIRKIFQNLLPDVPILKLENDCYTFSPNLAIQTDVEKIEQLYRNAKAIYHQVDSKNAISDFQSVISHYKGGFLEGMYDPWMVKKRDHYREIYLYSLHQLSNIYFGLEHFFEAIKYNKMMLDQDACMEDVHRKLMICYHRLNRNIKVIRQFQQCKKILELEMGIAPSKKTVALLEELTNQ